MKHVIRKSLIGQAIEVVEASNTALLGLKGTVVDESKYMFTIDTGKGRKQVIKEQVTLCVLGKKIPGTAFTKRIEERIKG